MPFNCAWVLFSLFSRIVEVSQKLNPIYALHFSRVVLLSAPKQLARIAVNHNYKIIITIFISRKFHVNMFKCALQTNLKQILNNILLKYPTGRRLTSWLFTKRGGVEFGTT